MGLSFTVHLKPVQGHGQNQKHPPIQFIYQVPPKALPATAIPVADKPRRSHVCRGEAPIEFATADGSLPSRTALRRLAARSASPLALRKTTTAGRATNPAPSRCVHNLNTMSQEDAMNQAIALAVILGVVGGLTGAWLLQRYDQGSPPQP